MTERRFPPLAVYRQDLPPTTVIIILISYLLLNLGCVLLITYSLSLSITSMVMINLLLFILLKPQWLIPLYILVAAPSIIIPLGSTGILTRLFAGNLIFALLVVIGFLRIKAPRSASSQPLSSTSVMIPLFALVLVGLISMIFSRLVPDLHVIYKFPHSTVSLNLVNTMEMVILLGMPTILLVAPGLMRTMREVKWIIRAFVGTGMLYALGTIFAAPLGLFSQYALLGNQRPEIFGLSSSILGMLLVFFVCITLGHALYTQKSTVAVFWWVATAIISVAVILSFGRESWLALFLSVLIMISFRTKNLSVLLIMLMFLLCLFFVPGVFDFFNPDKVYGLDRLNIWRDALTIWLKQPYFGAGAGNFQFFDIAYGTEIAGVAHNQFLEVLAEMGVQGLLCLLWSLFAVGRLTLQRFRTATTPQGKAIALAGVGYYITIIFGGFFTDSFLPSVAGAGGTPYLSIFSYQWLLLGLVLTLPRWEKSASTQNVKEPCKPLASDVIAPEQTAEPQLAATLPQGAFDEIVVDEPHSNQHTSTTEVPVEDYSGGPQIARNEPVVSDQQRASHEAVPAFLALEHSAVITVRSPGAVEEVTPGEPQNEHHEAVSEAIASAYSTEEQSVASAYHNEPQIAIEELVVVELQSDNQSVRSEKVVSFYNTKSSIVNNEKNTAEYDTQTIANCASEHEVEPQGLHMDEINAEQPAEIQTLQIEVATLEKIDDLVQLQEQIQALQLQLAEARAHLQAAKERETELQVARERRQQLQEARQHLLALYEEHREIQAKIREIHARIAQY